jgi:hypothetical protein
MHNETHPPRRLSTPLLLGLLISPPVFVWFLLRRGYSNGLRAAAFSLAAFILFLGLIQSISL